MDKEEKGRLKKKEDQDMPAILKANNNPSFADFVAEHQEQIRKLSDNNWKKNSEGEYVITPDDAWLDEDHWDRYFEELHRKK